MFLFHFLVMTSALVGVPGPNELRHRLEDLLGSTVLLNLKPWLEGLKENNIFQLLFGIPVAVNWRLVWLLVWVLTPNLKRTIYSCPPTVQLLQIVLNFHSIGCICRSLQRLSVVWHQIFQLIINKQWVAIVLLNLVRVIRYNQSGKIDYSLYSDA